MMRVPYVRGKLKEGRAECLGIVLITLLANRALTRRKEKRTVQQEGGKGANAGVGLVQGVLMVAVVIVKKNPGKRSAIQEEPGTSQWGFHE